ncbi:hypothetical protein PHMEG_000628 [Phytophthora megakarya]|uniref:WRKY19-like zinc finger domain-containing protein n=1 Tax=Phytophthora megakarya TaxID=4795 RepID=A0A225X350_9STRA|nr:hypothetical protein PHMEG_000628 [Phytophthora megakarya]
MDPRASPITASLYNYDNVLSLPLLDDEDFESTMMMLDNAAFRREDPDDMEMHLSGLSDAFNSYDKGSPVASNATHSASAGGAMDVTSCLSPDLKIRVSGRTPIGGRTPVGGDVYIKQESDMPGFSPVMDSFLRESWDDIVVQGCDKSSQGGGLCRAHGGGKKCRIPGCSKGTQRLGLCYLHGGIRRCIMEGCKKKDRGNGYCISHGGGRRCEAENCNRSVRKGNHCQMHQVLADDTPFQISRGQGLTSS